MGSNKSKIAFEVCYVTEDCKQFSDPPALFIILYDEKNNKSPIFKHTELIQVDEDKIEAKYSIESKPWCRIKHFSKLNRIEFWRANEIQTPYDWYLDKVIIRDRRKGLRGYWEYFFFPVHRWINCDQKYIVTDCETFKAHEDPMNDVRTSDIEEQCHMFSLYQRSSGFPVEVENIPDAEHFNSFEKWDIEAATQTAIEQRRLNGIYEDMSHWESIEELNDMYSINNITEPIGLQQSILDDICFGAQRLKGCNPLVLRLCTQIPENFEVTPEWLKPHLEGWTVNHVIKARRMYQVDYKIMEGLNTKTDRIMPSPLALFFFTENRQLKPLAIQLTQNSESGNLVFLPSDPPALWNLAKMWFNLSDACHHLILGRLLNQMILENVFVALKRNFGRSHPIYQILAPHFHHTLIVSQTLKDNVFNKNGWIARNIQLSKKGVKQLIKRGYKQWSFETAAILHKDLQNRNVYDVKALNNYPYRDDALLLYDAITNYVRKLVKLFYPNGKADLMQDTELQNWRRELASSMNDGGMGLNGIPGGENSKPNNGYLANTLERGAGGGSMTDISVHGNGSVFSGGMEYSAEELANSLYVREDLVRLLSGLIHLSVVVCGSALRSPMYDEYGYPINYPIQLRGPLPADPGAYNEDVDDASAIVDALPSKHSTLDVLITVRMAARVPQSIFGKFDSDYLYNEKALVILEEFRKNLLRIHQTIEKRNTERDIYHQYYCLDPILLPNYPGV